MLGTGCVDEADMGEAFVGAKHLGGEVGLRGALELGEVGAGPHQGIGSLVVVGRLLLPGEALEVGLLERLAGVRRPQCPLGSEEDAHLVDDLGVRHA